MKPLGFFAAGLPGTSDADILNDISLRFGSQLQELTRDDKGAVLICLIDAVTGTQQVVIEECFWSDHNGGELWELAKHLSPGNQIALSVAIANQLATGER